MPPPSRPFCEITNSPRLRTGPAIRVQFFTGWPKWRAIWGDQLTENPILVGLNGAMGTPLAASGAVQCPSDPKRAQLAPPSARTVTSADRASGPFGVSKASWPSCQPVHFHRVCRRTLRFCRRSSQARNKGEAFIAAGKTRPLVPVKTGWPRSRAHAAISALVNFSSIGNSQSAASP